MPFDLVRFPWIFPILYLVHVAEEHWGGGGYCEYLGRTRGVRLTPLRFVVMTGIGCLLMVVAILLAEPLDFPRTQLVIFATLFLANGLAHARTAARERRYHPGLASAVLLWVPLGVAMLVTMRGPVAPSVYAIDVAVGILIQIVVSRLAGSGERIAGWKTTTDGRATVSKAPGESRRRGAASRNRASPVNVSVVSRTRGRSATAVSSANTRDAWPGLEGGQRAGSGRCPE